MKVAKGEFIAFQDSDDLWVKDKLKHQLKCFEDPAVVAEYGNAEYIEANGKKTGRALLKPGRAKFGNIFDEAISKTKQPFPTNTMIVRKSTLDKVGGFNERLVIATDTECWIRVSTQGNFHFTDRILGYVRRQTDNISDIPSEGGWLKSIYRNAVNRVELYTSILEHYPKLLSRSQIMKLNSRLIETYDYISLLAKKLSYEQEDSFKVSFKKSPKVRGALFFGGKRSLYTTQVLRGLMKVSPSAHEKFSKWRQIQRERNS